MRRLFVSPRLTNRKNVFACGFFASNYRAVGPWV